MYKQQPVLIRKIIIIDDLTVPMSYHPGQFQTAQFAKNPTIAYEDNDTPDKGIISAPSPKQLKMQILKESGSYSFKSEESVNVWGVRKNRKI